MQSSNCRHFSLQIEIMTAQATKTSRKCNEN
nr:MAG TPA: hypothetical protein [Caudoviricetes sp.]